MFEQNKWNKWWTPLHGYPSLEADGEPTFQFGGMFQGTGAIEKRQNAEKQLTHDGNGVNVESKYVQAPLD